MSSDEFITEDGEILRLNHKGKPLTPAGGEILDPRPLAPPVGYRKQPSMAEQIRDMIRSERLAQEAAAADAESFEDADDFDIGDDYDPSSPYEGDFDPIDVETLKAAIKAERQSRSAASADDESGEAAEPEPQAPLAKPKPKAKNPPPDPEEA